MLRVSYASSLPMLRCWALEPTRGHGSTRGHVTRVRFAPHDAPGPGSGWTFLRGHGRLLFPKQFYCRGFPLSIDVLGSPSVPKMGGPTRAAGAARTLRAGTGRGEEALGPGGTSIPWSFLNSSSACSFSSSAEEVERDRLKAMVKLVWSGRVNEAPGLGGPSALEHQKRQRDKLPQLGLKGCFFSGRACSYCDSSAANLGIQR